MVVFLVMVSVPRPCSRTSLFPFLLRSECLGSREQIVREYLFRHLSRAAIDDVLLGDHEFFFIGKDLQDEPRYDDRV